MSDGEDQDRAVATLRRIAFLLERAQASRYRAEAYRAAARTVERQDAARLHALAAAGALTDLPGVGRSTAEVVAHVLAGRAVPTLDTLESQARTADAELAPQAAELHAALRGDLHSHTDASDGATSVQEMVLAAIDLGRDYLAVTDHSPRLTVAHGLSAARLRAQLAQLAALRPAVAPFEVLSGIEVDILDDGALDQDPDLLDELDVVVASVHSKLRMDRAAMTRRMLAAVRNPRTDVLGHCTGRQVAGKQRPPSEFDARAVFDACAEHGVAVEINCRPDRLDPPHELLQIAADAGCEFTIDSDAHAPGQLDWLRAGCARAAAHGIGPDRVVTTRGAAHVRTRGRR
ncbi:PHP domain-containing protein [Cellulomonas phragmiteti]|uniref:PHP domain-containing protein n=1 Tax=Cellulomonas phragmiteti TaxID=478780 RepID=A0ABQ4DJ37_9CELL|nr:PHP domain-containing protein [Cellulomonas phragmiteti]GIG39372.1 PHP domain-containing protein [Cellulomonas phragmiteti]